MEQQRLRKAAEIDLRCKGSLVQWVELLEREGHAPEWVEVSGANLEGATLRVLDESHSASSQEVGWLALPNSRTPLLNGSWNRWQFEELCRVTLRRQPVVLETEGLNLHCKTVVLIARIRPTIPTRGLRPRSRLEQRGNSASHWLGPFRIISRWSKILSHSSRKGSGGLCYLTV